MWSIGSLDVSQIDLFFNEKNENITKLAHPASLVFDNEPATLKSITEHPYVSGYKEPNNPNENATPIVKFYTVGFVGTCTPHLTSDNQNITMELSLEHSYLSGYNERILNNKSKEKLAEITRRTMKYTKFSF